MSSRELGSVTAYSIAVKYGFEGTEAEWMQAILNAGENAQDAAESAQEASNSATSAENSATSAEESAEKARIQFGSPLVAHLVADMEDENRVYVYVGEETGYTTGDWYYYDGSEWTSGGSYNAEGVNTDPSLSIEDMPADAKAVGDAIDDVKADLAHITSSAVPTTVRQAIKTLFETGGYADTGLTDEMAVISSWASQVTGITLNQSSISISGATTSQLVATTTPAGGTVTWSSSDTSVATVSSNGLVTGVGNGTATITATSGDVSATCTATVSGFATLTSISAVYTQSGTVYDTDTLDSLKDDLVVTAYYDDTTTATVPSADYTLSGTLEVGTSTIVVSYGGKTTTFNVTVQASVITVEVEGPNTTLNESATIGTSYENCKKYNEDRYCPVSAIPVSVGDVITISASNIGTNTMGIYLLWFDADQNYTGVHASSWDTTGSYTVDQSYPYLGFAISTRPTQTAIRTATDITVTVQRN